MVNFVCEGNKEKEGLAVSGDSQALLRIHSPTRLPPIQPPAKLSLTMFPKWRKE